MSPIGRFKVPPRTLNRKGEPRRVGYELEFSGLTLERTGEVMIDTLSGSQESATAAQLQISVNGLGDFGVEIDWSYLKRLAREHQDYTDELNLLGEAATLLVPVEIVCPPLTIEQLPCLEKLVARLREAGARGTDDSPIAAYGVHINPELPDLEPATINAYIKAFCLLQWWLVKANQVDVSRRITPYIDLYPDVYLKLAVSRRQPDMSTLISDYLRHNATRNRALDLLPLLMEIDPDRVRNAVDDERVKARPTFHYRLPNCMIGASDWTLSESWNLWWIVEELACRDQDLQELGDRFIAAWRPLFGINRSAWKKTIGSWLQDSGLV